jgi:hypothetical protein
MDNSQVKSAQVKSEDHSVVIDISNNSPIESTTFYCSHCNSRLIPFTQEDKKGGFLCVKCQIEYWPKQEPVKKADKFDLPGPPTDEHGNIIDDQGIPIITIDRQA